MILVADSGSSKADWILNFTDLTTPIQFRTRGINPFFLSEKKIIKILQHTPEIQPYLDEIREVYFFGAGCSSPDSREIISNALSVLFKNAFISVENDLSAAVYATCGTQPGLSCILGTGSNITYFDGVEIHSGLHGLGYILGDEGSGTYFGRKLITGYLYDTMPKNLQKEFFSTYGLNKESVIEEVYTKSAPNFFLASFTKFMSDHLEEPYIQSLLYDGFEKFINSNIKSYPDYKIYTTHFIGSIAYHFSKVLKTVCHENQVRVGKVLKHPIEELNKFVMEREMRVK
ncbi:N-acetylglucosamine kinase [Daejeonella oryzae]|uniref:N-acetylglucosamine kinase n=1 Tax=Daejeonella oryzae TaxID=1122943 RepID=UPI00041E773C|nr:N-acetylglucosamine kinase [Daejeonella oryzae]